MAKDKVAYDVRQSIMDKMDAEGRTLIWLSDKTGINYNTIHSCIKRKLFSLSEENLEKINTALETKFTLE